MIYGEDSLRRLKWLDPQRVTMMMTTTADTTTRPRQSSLNPAS
jgi:hypothetical protein